MKPRQNGIILVLQGIADEHQLLAAADRERFTALTKSAIAAEDAAAAAEERRKASWREYQELIVQAGLARGRHNSLSNDARRAAAEAADARRTLHHAVRDIYVTWERQQRNVQAVDQERFLLELADACGMPPRDLLRLVGRGPSTRTAAERDEDFERYCAGSSMRSIAKARGIQIYAVRKDIHARRARLVDGQSPAVDRSASEVEHLPATERCSGTEWLPIGAHSRASMRAGNLPDNAVPVNRPNGGSFN
jgi:hypothetical protein